MNREIIEAAVQRYYDAMGGGDVEVWLACFTDDIVSHSPVGGPEIRGRDGMRLALKAITNLLTGIQVSIDSLFPGGNGAAVKWTLNASGHDGRPVTFQGINLFELDPEGKIRRIHAYWDPNEMTRQLNT